AAILPEPILPEPSLSEASVPEPMVFEQTAPEPLVAEPVLFAAAEDGPEVAGGLAVVERPTAIASGFTVFASAGRVAARAAAGLFVAIVEGLATVREPAIRWLTRGAALVSTASVAGLIIMNRGELFTRLDHVSSMVVAAANRPQPAPAPVITLPKGVGRLTITSGETGAPASGTPPKPARVGRKDDPRPVGRVV